MVLWCLALTGFGAAVGWFGRDLPRDLRSRTIAVQGALSALFLAYTVFASNPMARLAVAPDEGASLNPLLQDPALAIHPPMLYLGYVGFSVVFSLAVAALIGGRIDAAWALYQLQAVSERASEFPPIWLRVLDEQGAPCASLHVASSIAGLRRERQLPERLRLRAIKSVIALAKRIDGLVGTRLFAHYFAPRFGSRDYRAAGDLRRTLVKTVNEDLAMQAQTIDVPTLLLWGEDDTETPVDLARNFNRLIKGSELFVFPHKGHQPFADVGSHLLAGYIERFIKQRGLSD
jgi:pimeloyl-ACP methyl ester carboxylesterase